MAKKSGLSSKSASKALSRISAFDPPLLKDEDAASYQKFLAHVYKDVGPEDILVEIWVRDVVDLSWDVFRGRRFIGKLLASNSLPDCIDHIERLDRLVMAAEARRNAALREIDRHRTSLAQNLRQKIQEPEDVEYELVEVIQPKDARQEKAA